MKRLPVFVALLLCTLVAYAQQPLNVWIKVPQVIPSNGIVSGTTNLPDGTILSIALAGSPNSEFNRQNCCFDAVVAVSHGAFGPVKIIETGISPSPGHYTVQITMRDWSMQPPNVVESIGQHGNALSGPMTVRSGPDSNVQASIPVEVR